MNDITGDLAKFIIHTKFGHIPKECIRRAKHCFLDFIGVTLAGSSHPIANVVIKYLRTLECRSRSTVIGCHVKTSVPHAAFANAATGHVLDYDDIKTLIGHPSVTIIPVVLSLAEQLNSNGKEILTAFIIGFEISSKIAKGVEPGQTLKGWHATSSTGIFGAVAAAGKLMKLNSEKMRYAFGIAATFASGLRRNIGTMTKPLHAGEAAEKGLKAALLSEMGITADSNILEGKYGFGDVFAKDYDKNKIVDRLGDPYEVLEGGFKLYPCCASAHTAIDALLFLTNHHHINPSFVEEIEVGTVPINLDNLIYVNPKNAIEARFSMQFCLATALLEKQVLLEHFVDQRIHDPKMIELMPKIKLFLHPDLTDLGYRGTENAIVKIKMKKGQEYVKRVDIPRGHFQNPLSEKELIWKYKNCCKSILSDKAIIRSIDLILQLDSINNIKKIMSILELSRVGQNEYHGA